MRAKLPAKCSVIYFLVSNLFICIIIVTHLLTFTEQISVPRNLQTPTLCSRPTYLGLVSSKQGRSRSSDLEQGRGLLPRPRSKGDPWGNLVFLRSMERPSLWRTKVGGGSIEYVIGELERRLLFLTLTLSKGKLWRVSFCEFYVWVGGLLLFFRVWCE